MDHITDQNPMRMYGILIEAGDSVPDYVLKTASLTEASVGNLHSKYFADPVNRELPVHTKAATYLSAAYFYSTENKNPTIEARIKKAAALFKIDEEVTALRELSTKQATPEPVYALVVEHPTTGATESVFRVDTPEFLIKSANDLDTSFRLFKLPYTSFVKAARVMAPLIKVSGSEDLIPESVLRAGILKTPDFKIAKAVAIRQANGDDELCSTLSGIIDSAETAYKEASYDETVLDTWANIWAEFSKEANVSFPDGLNSYTALFSGTPISEVEKQASAFVVIQDALIPLDVIKAADTSLIDVAFPTATASAIKQACSAGDSNDITKAFYKLSNAIQKRFLQHLAESAS